MSTDVLGHFGRRKRGEGQEHGRGDAAVVVPETLVHTSHAVAFSRTTSTSSKPVHASDAQLK